MNKSINLKPIYYQILTRNGLEVDNFLKEYYVNKVYPRFPEKEIILKKMLEKKKENKN